MKVSSQDISQKIQELLLNRVKNLDWVYFDLDFNSIFEKEEMIYAKSSTILKFFEHIQDDGLGTYEYDGNFSTAEILKVLFAVTKSNPDLLKAVLMRLFDINAITNESESEEGLIGKFNQRNRESRNKLFQEKIRNGFRDEEGAIVILAEGDSWFQFPKIYLQIDPVRDIIDWVIDDPKYAVHSLAAGGDWLANIFHSGEYIEQLPKISPDVFLLSGGGNDLIGNDRLAIMVINPKLEEPRDFRVDQLAKSLLDKRKASNEDLDIKKYERGLRLVSDEFFNFLNLYMVQYFVYLYGLCHVSKYKRMMIVTQGYDYAIPFNKNRGNWISLQRIVNAVTDTGHWLFEPLMMKGITDPFDQESVVYFMIHEFNEMLIQLAEFEGLPNLFHIDCRGVAEEDEWFDELHLKSDVYEKITRVYKYCMTQNVGMQNPTATKVYRVTDLL